jgi:hypothetical protein
MNNSVNAALYYNRSYTILTHDDPLPAWCEGLPSGQILDVVTKDGQNKYFKVVPSGRRGRHSRNADFKYICCDKLIQHKAINWAYFKNQSGTETTFVGRALEGREVLYQGFLASIDECRANNREEFTYTIVYTHRGKGRERLPEATILECLICSSE